MVSYLPFSQLSNGIAERSSATPLLILHNVHLVWFLNQEYHVVSDHNESDYTLAQQKIQFN